MVRLTWRTLSFSLALALLVPLGLKGASVDRDLEGIKKKIEKEKQGISQTQKKEGSILQSLEKIEEDWQRKTRELKDANAKLDSISTEMQRKEAEAEKIKNSMRNRQELLQRRAAALYRWYRSGSPFVILNGDVSLTAFLQRKRRSGFPSIISLSTTTSAARGSGAIRTIRAASSPGKRSCSTSFTARCPCGTSTASFGTCTRKRCLPVSDKKKRRGFALSKN